MEQAITKRQAEIIRSLINEYLITGQPVGSLNIVEKFLQSISSATVRKEMSVLEQMGYLYSPHTSAGRIPSDKAINFFVHELIEVSSDTIPLGNHFEEFYKSANVQIEKFMKVMAQKIATVSSNVGVVLAPQAQGSVIERIELVLVTGNIVLMVMVSSTGTIFQKKIKTESALSQEDLYKISRYLNQILKGYEIDDIRSKGLSFIRDSVANDIGSLCNDALFIAQNLIYTPLDQQVWMEGESLFFKKLLEEYPDSKKAELLIQRMEDRSFICELLNTTRKEKKINIQVGIKIDDILLSGVTVLSGSYSVAGRDLGSIGVIGLNRMPYQDVIYNIVYSSEILSSVLKEHNDFDQKSMIIDFPIIKR